MGDVVITMGAGNIRSVGVDLINLLKAWVVAKCEGYGSMVIRRQLKSLDSHQRSQECGPKTDGGGADGSPVNQLFTKSPHSRCFHHDQLAENPRCRVEFKRKTLAPIGWVMISAKKLPMS